MKTLTALFVALALSFPALAVVPDSTNFISYTGNGVTKSYSVPFKVLKASYLTATVAGVSKTFPNDFAVTLLTNSATLTFTVVPANGAAIVITRTVPLKQLQSFRIQGPLNLGVLEDTIDTLEMQIQQTNNIIFGLPTVKGSTYVSNGASGTAVLQPGADGTVLTANSASSNGYSWGSLTDQSATTATATGASTSRTLGSYFADAINVKDFGATSGSTSTQVGTAIAAACASLPAGKGAVWIPPGIPAGTTSPLPNNCQIIDLRGGTNTWGGPAFVNGIELANRWTSVGAGLQLPQPLHFDVDAYSGGVNEWPTGPAQKTQWTMLRGQLNLRTIGERKAIIVEMECQAKGDCANYFGINYDFGGYGTGGDEGSLGNRMWIQQGLGDGTTFPIGVVASASGVSVTGTWSSFSNHHIGEQRPVINTSRNVYNTGTIASVSGGPCVAVGAGTSWSTLGVGAHSDLFLEITGNTNGTMKWVVPIITITDDTHLTIEYNLNEFSATCLGPTMVKIGAYNIYHGANVLSLGTPDTGSADTSTVNFAIASTMFLAGDSIQQPVGYNWTPRGYHVRMNRFIGEPQGVGLTIGTDNYTPPPGQTYAFESGIRLEDSFQYAIRAGLGHNGFVDGLHFGSPVSNSLIFQGDFSAAQQTLFYLIGPAGVGSRTMLYNRTNDYWWLSAGQYFSGSDSRVGFGTTPQPNVAEYLFYNNATWAGLKIAPQVLPNAGVPILAAEVAGVPFFRVEGTRAFVNNGLDFITFKDNAGTQGAKIEGSTGKVIPGSCTFANIGVGSTANGTFVYCSDCTIASPCAGGGTGALAKRLNGVWVCN